VLGASSWNLPGSDVGGDLTGGSVDIYVANKTILSGAVIASDIDKLKLDTGSLEYRNIKDRDRGSNFDGGGNISGGAAPKSNSQSLSVSYGFTDKRQTNFATIGEGEITVMDGKTDLSKLNRDTSISQYNTKDGGLQGGFTLDSTTVDLVADIVDAPSKAYESRKKQVLDGLRDAKDTSVLIYKEAGVVVDKASNWVNDHLFTGHDEGTGENPEVGVNSEGYSDSKIRLDEKRQSYELTKETINGRDIIYSKDGKDVEGYYPGRFKQKEVDDKVIGKKTGCNYTADISMIVYKLESIGVDLRLIDLVEIYKDAKKEGAVWGNGNVSSATKLAKVINSDSNYKMVDGESPTPQNIINQIDNNNLVKVTLSDGHREIIYGYNIDKSGQLRFKIDDVGYQGDTYIDPKTMQPYKITNEGSKYEKKKYSKSHGNGRVRTVTNIHILK